MYRATKRLKIHGCSVSQGNGCFVIHLPEVNLVMIAPEGVYRATERPEVHECSVSQDNGCFVIHLLEVNFV